MHTVMTFLPAYVCVCVYMRVPAYLPALRLHACGRMPVTMGCYLR